MEEKVYWLCVAKNLGFVELCDHGKNKFDLQGIKKNWPITSAVNNEGFFDLKGSDTWILPITIAPSYMLNLLSADRIRCLNA